MRRRSWPKMESTDIRIILPSQLGYEKIAMNAAAAMAELMGFSRERIEDLRTAVSEACINAIEHGNKLDALRPVEVMLHSGRRTLKIEVYDNGGGFQRLCSEPSLEKKLAGEEPPRGWGLFLIERLVDRVDFKTMPEAGHVTTMTMRL